MSGIDWGRLARCAVVVVEVEAIDCAEGEREGIERAAGGDQDLLVPELRVSLEGVVVGEVDVHAHPRRKHVGVGLLVDEETIGVAAPLIFDLAAAEEEVTVRV